MEPLSKEFLQNRMKVCRDMRIQKAIHEIYECIKTAAEKERTECNVQIVPKGYPHYMLNTVFLHNDIAEEVYIQLQSLLGDITHTKIDNMIRFQW
jgi:hypothetical protein